MATGIVGTAAARAPLGGHSLVFIQSRAEHKEDFIRNPGQGKGIVEVKLSFLGKGAGHLQLHEGKYVTGGISIPGRAEDCRRHKEVDQRLEDI